MAEDMDDAEFWLPPQFLADDDVLSDFKSSTMNPKSRESDSGAYFPHEFPFGFGSFGPYSDLSSPVESVVSSTETESDEEDFIAGLTWKMAHSTLQDDLLKLDSGFGFESQKKAWMMAGSPQSTLCSVMGGYGCKDHSSSGSPNCPSLVSSPPPAAAAFDRKDTAWNLLYAAAGEVARLRTTSEGIGYNQNGGGGFGAPRKPCPVPVPLKYPNPNLNSGFNSNQSLSYQQLQFAQFQQLKQQQMMKKQGSTAVWGKPEAGGGHYQQSPSLHQVHQSRARNAGRPPGLFPAAWPTLQQSQQQLQPQQPGSGMRAVFLGNTGSKRECAGTGVFLPRRIGSPTESRKKPGCSTVLLPDRVVQALNLNLDSMDAQPQLQSCFNGICTTDYDAALKHRNNALMAQQRRNVRAQAVMNQELRLPSEWTY
ncbi:hypothetical protein U1Q18_013441 [Sarracenia purpurea var. burkii]